MITDNEKAALLILKVNTRYTFDVWALAGPTWGRTRANIMSALLNRNVPIKDAGVTVIRSAFNKLAGVDKLETVAARESAFIEWAKGQQL